MKPRTLKTYPILAVALTAAGCTRPAPPEPRPEVVPVAVAPAPAVAPPAAPAGHGTRGARRRVGRLLWPPTDADGYPLVGNLIRKGGPPERPDAGADGGGNAKQW